MDELLDWAMEKSIRGVFWRPDQSYEEACHGTLTLTSNGGAVLELFDGWRSPDPLQVDISAPNRQLIPNHLLAFAGGQPSHRRILGIVEGWGNLTLDRCVAAGWRTSLGIGISSATYNVDAIIHGLLYDVHEEFSLRELSFAATGLGQFLHDSVAVEATFPDGCQIQLSPKGDSDNAHGKIISQSPQDLGHHNAHVFSVRDFLTLSRSREAGIYMMYGKETNAPDGHSGLIVIRQAVSRNRPDLERQLVDPRMLLFTTANLDGSERMVLEAWLKFCERYADVTHLYFNNKFVKHMPIDTKLLALTRALDAWYRVDKRVTDDCRTPSLSNVIRYLIDKYIVEESVDESWISFSMLEKEDHVNNIRNLLNHPGRTSPISDLDALTLVSIQQQLDVLIQMCILKEIGIPDDVLKDAPQNETIRTMLNVRFIGYV